MFCTEMDGLEALNNVVVILASNRADLIDPATERFVADVYDHVLRVILGGLVESPAPGVRGQVRIDPLPIDEAEHFADLRRLIVLAIGDVVVTAGAQGTADHADEHQPNERARGQIR